MLPTAFAEGCTVITGLSTYIGSMETLRSELLSNGCTIIRGNAGLNACSLDM
jgi:hypothetical protein